MTAFTQALITTGVLCFVFALLVSFINKDKKKNSVVMEKLEKESEIQLASNTENKITLTDFGFMQGLKFAFGFWIGTTLLSIAVVILFGSILSAVASTFLRSTVDSAFIKR